MRWIARNGRLMLVAGLAVGLAWPEGGALVQPWLPVLIAVLLFLAALRIGPGGVIHGSERLVETVAVVLVCQLVLPVTVALGVVTPGAGGAAGALALVLVLAAPPLAGSPNLTVLAGGDPAPALRLLVVGTALLPLTSLPVLALLGLQGLPVLTPVLRLMALVLGAAAAALLAHRWLMRRAAAVQVVDGVSALVMTVMVLGLMAAAAQALRDTPLRFALWLAIAVAVNFGLQGLAALALRGRRFDGQRTALSIVAGNRNIALFLVVLPPEVMAPLMLFVGCYQIPMYLTPYLAGRGYLGK